MYIYTCIYILCMCIYTCVHIYYVNKIEVYIYRKKKRDQIDGSKGHKPRDACDGPAHELLRSLSIRGINDRNKHTHTRTHAKTHTHAAWVCVCVCVCTEHIGHIACVCVCMYVTYRGRLSNNGGGQAHKADFCALAGSMPQRRMLQAKALGLSCKLRLRQQH